MPEPPRWTIRHTAAILTTSVLLVVVAGVPALAGSSLAPAEVEADTDTALTLTVTEPTDEQAADYGDTARVVVRAPTGFSDMVCESGLVWSCTVSEDGTRVTFTRNTVALGDTAELEFTTHTATVNGPYEFRVTQADGPPAGEGEEPPTTITSRPAVTVTGGSDPTPEPTAPADDGASQDGGTDSDGSQPDGGADGDATAQGGEPSPPADGDGQDAATDDSTTSDSGSTGGSTAPRRTQGRASGTTLEITPGEPAGDDPAIAPPAVADDAAVTPPGGTAPDLDSSDSTAAAAAGTQPSDQPGSGAPWQQWVGGTMLLAGLVTVGVRWYRERRAG